MNRGINIETSSWLFLVFMAFALGLRHGFDLDHLATIDSMTRTLKNDARLSKFVGVLFSVGHGLVVIVMSLIIGLGFIRVHSPMWLEIFGNWISIFFLLLFGLLTLWNTLSNASKLPTGMATLLFRKIPCEKYNPLLIMFIGALFAFSFDTFTQVALFSISASVMTGYIFTIILGIIFMCGMMASDGLNGLFVSLLIQSADKKSVLISRCFGLLIAGFSLILAVKSVWTQLQ